jgi:protein-S-isoprenylcysteine O-methyltransferase Ste14
MSSSGAYSYIPSLFAISYGATILFAAYLNHRCFIPPNPITKPRADDSLVALTRGFNHTKYISRTLAILFIYHSICALLSGTPAASAICPHPERFNPALLTWSPQSLACLSVMVVGCSGRLAAYRGLGPSFTFTITVPKKGLVTTGIYRYLQHPSYAAYLPAGFAMMMFLWRADGPAACWVEPGMVMRALHALLTMGYVGTLVYGFRLRVRDEEALLKAEFGQEWEVWNRRTARFVPFVW